MTESFESLFDGDATAVLSQKADWLESFTNVEQANQYTLVTSKKTVSLAIAELSNGFLNTMGRLIFGGNRASTFEGIGTDGSRIFRLKKKPAFIECAMSVFDAEEKLLGKIAMAPHPALHTYDLLDESDQQIGTMKRGELGYDPYYITDADDQPIAQFVRLYDGSLAKVVLTDADDYRIELTSESNPAQHWLPFVFGCVIMIDLQEFDDR